MRINTLPRIYIVVACISLLATLPLLFLSPLSLPGKIVVVIATVLIAMAATRYLLRDLKEGLSALETGLLNLKDGEFSSTLAYKKDDEIGHLCDLYNDTTMQLRAEKHWLYQRELLLDKVTQSSPEVLFLVNDHQQIIFSNIAARQFFQSPKGLDGSMLSALVDGAPQGAAEAIKARKEGLFTLLPSDSEPQTWHMSTGHFLLNNQAHTLYILKQMTRELSRQEVAVWKKVIRVISHELNNSLGPISSMLHSGKILSEQLNEEKLGRVFETIDDRIKHLSDFVQGYGKFAKLPEPKIEAINWKALIEELSQQWQFSYLERGRDDSHSIAPTNLSIHADQVQIEQLLINLLKNAHESGSAADQVVIEVELRGTEVIILVLDRGEGISDNVMSNALIPFYSTKPSGSGLGLALCREIIDAHHGQIGLYNRDEGGLAVRVSLPRLIG
jgi:nitrogen fixation/metabolism regulation signal transduction histidine kinase